MHNASRSARATGQPTHRDRRPARQGPHMRAQRAWRTQQARARRAALPRCVEQQGAMQPGKTQKKKKKKKKEKEKKKQRQPFFIITIIIISPPPPFFLFMATGLTAGGRAAIRGEAGCAPAAPPRSFCLFSALVRKPDTDDSLTANLPNRVVGARRGAQAAAGTVCAPAWPPPCSARRGAPWPGAIPPVFRREQSGRALAPEAACFGKIGYAGSYDDKSEGIKKK